ncbi:MAG: type IV pilus twitching motility protein PilT [Armatimonadetes bacterium]|nr:type IV pilus twitching motility protein PilT [Armatimonadota bacterium]
MATTRIDELLHQSVRMQSSDLILKAQRPPLLRVYGDLMPLPYPPLSPEEVRDITYSVLTDQQRERFERHWELDLAYHIPGLARFRVNLFKQRGFVGSAWRTIPLQLQSMEELGLPPICRYFCERPRGLVLVTGSTGTGKTTTQAAMIDYINQKFPLHIVTIEDPIEFVHECKLALINQRELGIDTLSFPAALKHTLRQDPDVILVGEMRDLETISLAITAAETGQLVFGTLHTTDAVQTVDRIVDVFPPYQQNQIRMQLAVNLIGVISQTLLKRADGQGRVAAFETLVAVPAIRNLIRESKTYQVVSMIQTGARQGMTSMDQYLGSLVKQKIVTFEAALAKAVNQAEFRAIVEGVDQPSAASGAAARPAR